MASARGSWERRTCADSDGKRRKREGRGEGGGERERRGEPAPARRASGPPFTENMSKFPGSRQHDLPHPLSCWPYPGDPLSWGTIVLPHADASMTSPGPGPRGLEERANPRKQKKTKHTSGGNGAKRSDLSHHTRDGVYGRSQDVSAKHVDQRL